MRESTTTIDKLILSIKFNGELASRVLFSRVRFIRTGVIAGRDRHRSGESHFNDSGEHSGGSGTISFSE